MAHRVNVVLDDEAWEGLRHVRRGDRSRFVSEAVREATLRRRRRAAAAELAAISAALHKPEGTAEEWVRADRDGR
jgi:hypothetical protein